MASPTVLTVTSGAIGLAEIPAGTLDLATVDCFCSQTTEATLAATSNTTDVPATLCSPASTKAVLSSWAVTYGTLQDWGRTDGTQSLSEWLYEHDGGEAICVLYLNEGSQVKAVAKVTIVAGSFGGPGGETLVSTSELPCIGTPDVYKNDGTVLRHGAGGATTASFPVTGVLDCSTVVVAVDATGYTAPAVGLIWLLSPAGAVWPAAVTNLATLKAHAVLGDGGTGAPSRTFTTGEYIIGPGATGHISYAAGTWSTGDAL